jgi:hypothetical protein
MNLATAPRPFCEAAGRQEPPDAMMYPGITERFAKSSIGVELRIRPRSRDRPHIDEQIHSHLPEQTQKFGDRMR